MRRRMAAPPLATILLLAAALAPAASSMAQQTGTATGPDPEGMTARLIAPQGEFTVGDPVALVLEVIHPQGAIVDPPAPGAFQPAPQEGSPEGAEVFAVEEISPAPQAQGEAPAPLPAGSARTAWRVVIRPFATGPISIPAVTLKGRVPGGAEVEAATDPVTLGVMSVLHDATEAPAGIKGPWTIPADVMRLLLILLAAVVALSIALILYRRWRAKRRSAAATAPAAPVILEPAWIRALRELEALLGARLIEQGRIKEFHVTLAEIVKKFLGEHHAFDALDRTSEEVLVDLRRMRAGGGIIERTELFLTRCDLVKFAKHAPGRPEIDETVGEARALIETGRASAQGAAA